MDDLFPRGQTALVSGATFGIGEAPGHEEYELAAHAAVRALDKAGLKLGEVDGLFAMIPSDGLGGLLMAQYLGLRPRYLENSRAGGSSFQSYAAMAALALATGQCDVALIVYGSNQRSGAGRFTSALKNSAYESAYKALTPISSYALAASRHMHLFGTTRRQLAEVAVAARGWANLNPDAYAQGRLTIDDVLASRMVSDPLSRADCCLVTDGAAAVVMTRADRARDLVKRPGYLLGAATAISHRDISSMADLTVTGAAHSGARAYAQAKLGPQDVDAVQVYDAFTINTILFLEDLGFCPKGEGGRFVEDGRIAPGGTLPVNTNGGGLSCVHPGMYGLFGMVEALEQIGGEAGERQVPGVEVALSHGNGGVLSSQATVILGSEATL